MHNSPTPFGAVQDPPGQSLVLGPRRRIHPATIAALTDDKAAAAQCDERHDPVEALRRHIAEEQRSQVPFIVGAIGFAVLLVGVIAAVAL